MGKSQSLIFSGVQPSGAQVHIGNYIGAMRRFVELSQNNPAIFCVVDLHALTSVTDAKALNHYTHSLAAAYLAIGIDPAKTILFRQSDVAEVVELTWYLACQFPFGLLERAHSLKDAKAKNITINSGVAFYPILMAADILLYKATGVPVGADQKQHLEMTRDVAERFNNCYGDIFPIPEPMIEETSGLVTGLDGRKMSKSYDNYIGLFESAADVRKKIMRIVTDSKGVEDKKDPDTCNVFSMYKLFASSDEQAELSDAYRRGGLGYGKAKEELLRVVERELVPLRERYNLLMAKPDELSDVLSSGAKKAREIAERTIEQVRTAVGIGPKL